MLSQKDLDKISKLIDERLEEKLEEKIKFLPTKEEFFSRMDSLMKEIRDLREEVSIVTGYKDQIEDHETRITKLEEVLTTESS